MGDVCWHKCDSRTREINMAANLENIELTPKEKNVSQMLFESRFGS